MNRRIENMLAYILDKKHHAYRQDIDEKKIQEFTESLSRQQLPDMERAKQRLAWVLEHEVPVILPGEKIAFTRTVRQIPEIFTRAEWDKIKKSHYIHELGSVCNISSNYIETIEKGFDQRRTEIKEAIQRQSAEGDAEGVKFLEAVLKSVDDVQQLADRYALKAM